MTISTRRSLYGYAKLSDLMGATTLFELDRRSSGDGKPGVIYARDKRRHPDRKPKPAPASPRVDTSSTGGAPGTITSDDVLASR